MDNSMSYVIPRRHYSLFIAISERLGKKVFEQREHIEWAVGSRVFQSRIR